MRLTEFAECLLEDIEKGVVPMVDNFDGTEKEPLILPARFPNALVNGNQGIAVGIATNIPPHNLGEVIDAFIYYMSHKRATVTDLLKIMPGPDYPTSGIIINKDDLINLYRTGAGRVITRAKINIERNKTGKDSLIITEIPYALSGSKTKIIDSINDLIIAKKLPEVIEVRDESSKEGIRINLILRKEMSVKELNKLENKLFKSNLLSKLRLLTRKSLILSSLLTLCKNIYPTRLLFTLIILVVISGLFPLIFLIYSNISSILPIIFFIKFPPSMLL